MNSCIPDKGDTMFNRKDSFNDTHPELQPGEIFYTNVGPNGDLSKYDKQTTRFGKQTYTTAGKRQTEHPSLKEVLQKLI